MKALIEQYYPIQVSEIKKLGGYDNANFLVIADNEKYIFKTYLASEKNIIPFVNAETKALIHLDDFNTSKPIKGVDDRYFYKTELKGETIIIRLLSFVKGDFMKNVPQTDLLLQSFGSFLAKLDLALGKFTNYFIQSNHHAWDNQYWRLNQDLIPYITRPSQRKLVEHFFLQYEEHVVPQIPVLRQQIVHNDANKGNVLVENGVVSGIIDFGDISYSFLINDLANAIAYAVLGKKNPLEIAVTIIKSYTKVIPLLKEEIDVLFYLIATRLSVSVCNSAYGRLINPENKHIFTTEKLAIKFLELWIVINPIQAINIFRIAASF